MSLLEETERCVRCDKVSLGSENLFQQPQEDTSSRKSFASRALSHLQNKHGFLVGLILVRLNAERDVMADIIATDPQ